jgi:ATP-dependent DNA helicase RecG
MGSIHSLGLTAKKEEQFRKKGITTTKELAAFFPRRYLDMRQGKLLHTVTDGEVCAVDGIVVYASAAGMYPIVHLQDAHYDTLEIIWFGNTDYYFKQFEIGKHYRVAGKVSFRRGEYRMANPSLFFELGKGKEKLYPVYPKITGMSDAYLQSSIKKAIATEEAHYIPDKKDVFAAELGLVDYFSAVKLLHDPKNEAGYKAAKKRMAFQILYDFYLEIKKKRADIPIHPKLKISSKIETESFIKSLPFPLTEGQQQAVDAIISDAMQMHRIDTLITGDVGCGKTMVAMIAAMLLWENGFQTAVMAPTLVLAKQHFEEFTSRIPEGWEKKPEIALLTSETKKRERTQILKGLAAGQIDILIGTSSVLSDELEFQNLGLTIVDEEHKFGTEQKAVLEKKKQSGLHHIAMTATPIPRSLARTIYGEDFGILSITTMPKGRKPVITKQSQDKAAIYEQLAEQVKLGRQAYIVCPFISDSDSERFMDVDSVESVEEEIRSRFKRTHPQIRIASINGRMKQSAVLQQISAFAKGEIDILISTTIVEVGVNVPNATAMMIMSAERFGLAALHQLRGRVGRAQEQGYCYLMSDKHSEKLEILCRHTNGFLIAEEDMRLRGPGNLAGEAQTGYSEAIEMIIRRPKLAQQIRQGVEKL